MGLLFKNSWACEYDGRGYVREARAYVNEQYKEKGLSAKDLPHEDTVTQTFFRDEDSGCEVLRKELEIYNVDSFNQLMTAVDLEIFSGILASIYDELKSKGYYNIGIKRYNSNFYVCGERPKTAEEIAEAFKRAYDCDVYVKAKKLKKLAEKNGETAKQRREELALLEELKKKYEN